jgi:hypothetical protein
MVSRKLRVATRSYAKIGGYLIAIASSLFFLAAYLHWLVKELFSGINPTVAGASEAAIATVAVSLGAVMFQRISEDRRQRSADLREPKVELYEKYLFQWAVIFDQIPKQKNADGSEIEPLSELSALLPELLSWSSDEVVAEMSTFRRYNYARGQRIEALKSTDPDAGKTAEEAFDPEISLGFERIVLAIRRDLGHSNSGIRGGDLLGLWINDIDQYFTRSEFSKWRKERRKRRKEQRKKLRHEKRDRAALSA